LYYVVKVFIVECNIAVRLITGHIFYVLLTVFLIIIV